MTRSGLTPSPPSSPPPKENPEIKYEIVGQNDPRSQTFYIPDESRVHDIACEFQVCLLDGTENKIPELFEAHAFLVEEDDFPESWWVSRDYPLGNVSGCRNEKGVLHKKEGVDTPSKVFKVNTLKVQKAGVYELGFVVDDMSVGGGRLCTIPEGKVRVEVSTGGAQQTTGG